MEMMDMAADDTREELRRKLRSNFDGRIVRKDLTKKIKEGANVPVYVLEFLLGQYCSSDDETKLALPTLIALCSIALGRPTVSTLAVLGEISISGTILKVDELANSLQVCLDSGAKKVLLPITSAADLGTVPPELVGSFNLIFYSSAEDAVFKALGVE